MTATRVGGQVKFIRMVDRVVVEKGETNEEGFAIMQAAHPGEYREDTDDKPLAPVQRAHSMFERANAKRAAQRPAQSDKVGTRAGRKAK
jgi:hypothetical protein